MGNNVYVAHRESQSELILDVAEELFTRKGIEQVTMGQIAREAHLTRATIYKYYANKEEIAQEIFKIITMGWRDRNEREVWGFQGNGYQRLEKFITSFLEYLSKNPHEAGFVAEINYLYAKNWPAEMFVQTMLKNLTDDRQFVLESIHAGIADGSLRSDLEPELTLAAFFNFLSGMISRFGELGAKLEDEYGISSQTIFEQIFCIFLNGLKSQP